ncbi:MAG: hypothetical protein U0264_11130 [Candidatus Kapaibacterium sp.]
MYRLIVVCFLITAVVTTFYSITIAWVICLIPTVLLCFFKYSYARFDTKYIDELSPSANQMLRKFGHFYRFPRTSYDLGRAALYQGYGVMFVVIFSLNKANWLFLIFGIANYFLMSILIHFFDPHVYLSATKENRDEVAAHEEVVEFLRYKLADFIKSQTINKKFDTL